MVKKILCLVLLVTVAFGLSAVAQTSAINRATLGDNHSKSGNPPTPPTYCNPCLMYAGDWDPNSSWVAYFNGTDTAPLDAAVYVPFVVPAGHTWKVNGLFTNNLALNIAQTDPNVSPWSISQGISEGNGGTVVASGSARSRFTATGRNYQNTYFEYTDQVVFPAVTLSSGTYWLTVVPQCTNTNDSACSSAYYYINDTIPRTNHFGPAEPINQSYTNSSSFGYNYTNVCNEGYPPPACSVMSAGVTGRSH
jgi:hypothetical protein